MANSPPRFEIAKHPEFRVIHINGFFGGLNPLEANIKFYLDIAEPRIKLDGKPGEMELDKVNREIQVEVRMSPNIWLAMAAWMEDHIKRLEKTGVLKREQKPQETTDAYRV